MSVTRTARRRRKQMTQNNNHLSGMGIPRYGTVKDASARARREQRKRERWAKMGSMGGGKKG